ncbi:hypothetical protein ACVWU4_000931 [Campylobacter coli]
MTEDELLESLDNPSSDAKPLNEVNENKNNNYKSFNKNKFYNNKPKLPNMWDNTSDIKAEIINPEEFTKVGNSYCIITAKGSNVIPDEMKEKFIKIIRYLTAKEFIFRNNLSATEEILPAICQIDNIKMSYYLPFKKFNPIPQDAVYAVNVPKAYNKAASFQKNFLNLSPAGRVLIANGVLTVLDKSTVNPVNFILGYSECGSESLSKDTDWESIGNCSLYIKLAHRAGIPFINIKNENSVSKLKELLDK